jgi:hypothetical protein
MSPSARLEEDCRGLAADASASLTPWEASNVGPCRPRSRPSSCHPSPFLPRPPARSGEASRCVRLASHLGKLAQTTTMAICLLAYAWSPLRPQPNTRAQPRCGSVSARVVAQTRKTSGPTSPPERELLLGAKHPPRARRKVCARPGRARQSAMRRGASPPLRQGLCLLRARTRRGVVPRGAPASMKTGRRPKVRARAQAPGRAPGHRGTQARARPLRRELSSC